MWGKGLNEMSDEIKSYLQGWSVEQIMKDDAVNKMSDPLGLFAGPPNWKVADLLAADPARDPHLMAALTRMGYDIAGYERGDVAARAMFGCYPGTMPSTGMVRTDRPRDPAKDMLVVFWTMNEISWCGMPSTASTRRWRSEDSRLPWTRRLSAW